MSVVLCFHRALVPEKLNFVHKHWWITLNQGAEPTNIVAALLAPVVHSVLVHLRELADFAVVHLWKFYDVFVTKVYSSGHPKGMPIFAFHVYFWI